MLPKKGNSHSDERMDLVDRFREIFPDAEIADLCGEREFIGKEWLTYLMLEPTIPFRLTIKANQKIHDGHQSISAAITFAHLQPGEAEVLSGRRWVWGRFVYVSALRLEERELLIILSDDSPTTAITDYAGALGD